MIFITEKLKEIQIINNSILLPLKWKLLKKIQKKLSYNNKIIQI